MNGGRLPKFAEGGGLGALARDLWSDGRGWVLLAVSLAHLLVFGTRLVFPALLPPIKAEFALDNTTAGLVFSALWVVTALSQLPGGLLADRIGERNILAGSVLAAALGTLVVAVAPVFAVFLAGILLFALGSGLFGPPRVTVLSDIYPARGATAIGINSAAGNLGTAALPVVAAVIAGWLVWQAGVAFLLPIFAVTVVALWVAVPERSSSAGATPGRSPRRAAREVLAGVRRRPVLMATTAMMFMTFIYQGLTAFFPTYLVSVKGLDGQTAAALFGVFFVGATLLQPFAGAAADRYGERRTLEVITATTVVALSSLPFLGSTWSLAIASLVAGFQLGFWPVVFTYAVAALPDEVQGGGFGLLRTVFLFGGAVGPTFVGAFADTGLFDEAFLVLAGAATIALLISSRLPAIDRG